MTTNSQTTDSPTINLPDAITVGDLAALMDMGSIAVIKQLMRAGYMFSINDAINFETSSMIAKSFGFNVESLQSGEKSTGSLVITPEEGDFDHLQTRPPVITILGHVDHGKTTLLDSIRKTDVVATEAGGITQHIGAYQISHGENILTFLDTPGHEAFTEMRARGARVTDIAILVVAADDGVMPQTVEAINHVKAAGVPIIAAINKVDRPNADPEKVKRQLSEHDLLVEDWGGDVISSPVSALNGDGVDELIENILVVSEIAELKANPSRQAKGVVVEAQLDKSKGPVATVLVQTGTLRISDLIVAGSKHGRIKAMFNDKGVRIQTAGPSTPVEVLGLDGIPEAGQSIDVAQNEKTARSLASKWALEQSESNRVGGVNLEDVHAKIETGEVNALELIVKTDVQGSVDAIRSALDGLTSEDYRVKLIHIATGTVTESDIMLAVASKAVIVGFNTETQPGARFLADKEGVSIRSYEVIYNLVDDIESALKGMLAPVMEDIIEGYATVRAIFQVGRKNRAAGIYVNDGRISRGAEIQVTRNSEVLFSGSIASLKHFRDDMRELTSGNEGGIILDGFADYQEGDVIESHVIREAG